MAAASAGPVPPALPSQASASTSSHSRASAALLNHGQRQSEQLLAQLCAENELVRLRLLRQLPGIGQSSASCEQGGQALTVTLVVGATPNPNFRRVEARVSSADSRPLLSLTTVMGAN
jgi:general secretion pathway protein I